MFLLDTDHIAIIQWQAQPHYNRLVQRTGLHAPSAFYVSIVSFHEQVLGANLYVSRSRTTQDVLDGYDLFQRILDDYAAAQVLPFDAAAAAAFDSLRAQRIRVGTMDLRIAAVALSRGLTVLTRNVGDFQKVPGLIVEDWTL